MRWKSQAETLTQRLYRPDTRCRLRRHKHSPSPSPVHISRKSGHQGWPRGGSCALLLDLWLAAGFVDLLFDLLNRFATEHFLIIDQSQLQEVLVDQCVDQTGPRSMCSVLSRRRLRVQLCTGVQSADIKVVVPRWDRP